MQRARRTPDEVVDKVSQEISDELVKRPSAWREEATMAFSVADVRVLLNIVSSVLESVKRSY